ncbi:MAG: aldo/keto reductase, partial [Deltaproteobacteria bacterium]|nr:aldo/keto reductase [Deltaproteobacteria bacterium]
MNYRSFGKTDLKVSELGLGCSSLGGGLYHRDDQESIKTLFQAFDLGINFYDTSDNYSQGNSERLIGQAFKGKRDRVIIASKGGAVFSPLGSFALRLKMILRPMRHLLHPMRRYLHQMRDSEKSYDYSPRHLTEAIHGSLKRLQTDYIDLYQLYNPSSSILESGEVFDTLDKLKVQGKIRYYGVSCVTVDGALLCLKHHGTSSVQVTINLLDQEAITKLIPLSQENKLAVIARVPLAQGLLTNAQNDTMAEQSARNQREFEDRKNRAKNFWFLVKENRTIAQAALQFVLQFQGVSVVIPGMINRRQLNENLGALAAPPLTKEELERIFS